MKMEMPVANRLKWLDGGERNLQIKRMIGKWNRREESPWSLIRLLGEQWVESSKSVDI